MFIRNALTSFAIVLALGMTAHAQHEGDVIFVYDANKIAIESGQLSSTGPANRFFETAFGTSGILDGFIGEPGFEAENPIGAGDAIGFNLHSFNGSFLNYFNGTTLVANHDKSLNINWLGAGNLVINQTVGGSGPINVADAQGAFHTHMEFDVIQKGAAHHGAYGVLMSLTTNGTMNGRAINASDPFWIVFNYGMTEEAFEAQALPAFNITAVPEPSTLALVSLAFGGLAWRRRRQLLGSLQ